MRPLVSCTVSPRRETQYGGPVPRGWKERSTLRHSRNCDKSRRPRQREFGTVPPSLCFSFLVVYLCQSLAANVVPSFIRRAFNVSVAVSLRLGPPEPHGQVARPRVIDEFVRDEERSALSVYLSRHFLPLCSQAATVQPSQTAQGELSAFDTSYTRSQSTAEGDKPVLGLESGHLAAKNSATVIGRLCA